MCAQKGVVRGAQVDNGFASLHMLSIPLPQLVVIGLPAPSTAVAPRALRSVHV
jgi:hypothetical protein